MTSVDESAWLNDSKIKWMNEWMDALTFKKNEKFSTFANKNN